MPVTSKHESDLITANVIYKVKMYGKFLLIESSSKTMNGTQNYPILYRIALLKI